MGCESGWMKLCGAPATSESCTLFQSEPTVLSTTAQPCRIAVSGPAAGALDFSGKTMRDVTTMCLRLGLEPVFSGSNLAIDQTPAAGTQVKSGSRVTVQFGTPPPARAAKAASAGKSHKAGQR